ncbi:MAG: cation transporter [Phycisphaeraceae bacterium]|nr:cation transporter [Phycisphaeraceae bacterium]
MPEPTAHPDLSKIQRVGRHALLAGLGITALKFGIFGLTSSIAVLSDALESIINILAAGVMLYSVWLGSQPVDRGHSYGHGKAEFMAVGFEGAMILVAGALIAYKAIARLIVPAELERLSLGLGLMGLVGVLTCGLAFYVIRAGRRYASGPLLADGRHLLTDFTSTAGVWVGLILVYFTGLWWLDPVIALVMAALILWTSGQLLHQSILGLMDHADPADDVLIRRMLDEEIAQGAIRGYHKLRHRHSGAFHWVDVHLQVPGQMTVAWAHELISRIEYRIEQALGEADVTAHIEPAEAAAPAPAPPPTGGPTVPPATGNPLAPPADAPAARTPG